MTSFVKDTGHFLYILSKLGPLPQDIILMTLDVTSLYTNVPLLQAKQAVGRVLTRTRPGATEPSNQSLIHLLDFVFTKIVFTFSDGNKLHYSVSPIYRGCIYRGIGYIAVACWTPFFWRPRARYFSRNRGNTLFQFAGDNFSRNLLTAIAFVPGSPETIFRKINSGLPVNAGWNTCCAMVSQARLSIDTSIVSQSRVRLIQCQCRSWLQIANLGINNTFLMKSSLADHAVYIRHLVQT